MYIQHNCTIYINYNSQTKNTVLHTGTYHIPYKHG